MPHDLSYAHDRDFHEALPPGSNPLTLLSWNVLADGLAESGGFINAPQGSLGWNSRREEILNQINTAEHTGQAPDLICLQEVDRFTDSLEPALHEAGYSSAFVAKAEGRDGCCVFWKRERFELRWVRPMRYRDDKGHNETQVALLVALVDTHDNAPLLVVTTHLKAKAGYEEVREHQARQLRKAALEATTSLGASAGLIVAGDFNDVPDSPAYRAMLEGGQLVSAYAACTGSEPDWSNWKMRSSGEVRRTIDYVFCNAALNSTAVLLPPPRASIDPARLPGERYPSDHLSLVARFERRSGLVGEGQRW